MSKERYNQIIDKVYRDYEVDTSLGNCAALNPQAIVEGWAPDLIDELSKEEFINQCKTDHEFSERWGLKIEERELSLEERRKMANYESIFISPMTVESWDKRNIPTKQTTLTYQNETIQFYE